jgi:hypothetical protein
MGESDLRRHVVSYLVGAESLHELHDWLTSRIWNDEVPDNVRSLANQIALPIDEFSSDALTEDQLKAALRPLVTDYTADFQFGSGHRTITRFGTATASASAAPLAMTPQFADTRLVAGS